MAALSQRYRAALRKHLRPGPPAGFQAAQELGRRAMTLGLNTLDLARFHEQALLALILPNASRSAGEAMVRRAGAFFARVITPLEQTHRTARDAKVRLGQLHQLLRRRRMDLAASNRRLKQEVTQRKSAEESLIQSEQHYGQLLAQSRRMQEQLRLLSHQLLLAQEDERKKISRELHDVIAQTLANINVRLAGLKSAAAANSKGIQRSIAETQQLVQRSVAIVHRFARELRPTVLDDLGLIPALHTFMKHFRQDTGIRVSLLAFAAVEEVDGDKRTVLFRIAQEALTNVARHAQATHAKVTIQKRDGVVCMTIKDNGQGFHKERAALTKKTQRLGLLGMRERLEMVGGKFTVTSAPGKGTLVLAQVPLIDRASVDGGSRADRVH